MRTNPKSGSPRNGSVVPRRRTARPKGPESAALPVLSEQGVPVPDTTIEDQIAKLAYSLWQARGGNGGSAEEDWYRAEQEILARSKA